jgi:hypothetical protein
MSNVARLLPTLAVNGQLMRDFLEFDDASGLQPRSPIEARAQVLGWCFRNCDH